MTAVLLGATLLGSTLPAGRLRAQTVPPSSAVSDTAVTKAETVEQRIGNLHEKLMITSAQEAAWANVAQAMRDNSAVIEKLVVAKKAKTSQDMTALDDLRDQAFAQALSTGCRS